MAQSLKIKCVETGGFTLTTYGVELNENQEFDLLDIESPIHFELFEDAWRAVRWFGDEIRQAIDAESIIVTEVSRR